MPFAVGLMVVLMVITVGYMPIVLPLLLQGVSVNPSSIARSLILLMLIPLALGLALRAWHPPGAARVRALVAPVSSISMIFVVVLTTAGHFGSMLSILAVRHRVSGHLRRHLFWSRVGPGRPRHRHARRSLVGTAQRNTAAALVVAGQNFSDAKVVVMITVVMIVSFAVLMPLARALAKRQQVGDVAARAAATR